MRIRSLRVTNFKSIADTGDLPMGRINLLVGANNVGKSSLLMAIYSLQEGSSSLGTTDETIRIGAADAELIGTVEAVSEGPWKDRVEPDTNQSNFALAIRRGNSFQITIGKTAFTQIPGNEPDAWIYPTLSRRKVYQYDRTIDQAKERSVLPTAQNLTSKVQRASSTGYEGETEYRAACHEMLGFVPIVVSATDGQRIGRRVGQSDSIPIEQMGEGVHSIVGQLCALSLARNKLFLIEELENDLHPNALKALLQLVAQSSEHNQFIISTHSHIVVSLLAGLEDTKVYRVSSEMGSDQLERTKFDLLGDDPSERMALLRDLGYELADFGLFDAWLILEESSMERLIHDHLVPWFAPNLNGRLRTVAADGVNDVKPRFSAYRRLFTYAHLEVAYRRRAWVLVDGDDAGKKVVDELRRSYETSWEPSHFVHAEFEALETKYPTELAEEYARITVVGRDRQDAKKKLLDKLLAWINNDEDRAREWAAESLPEVVRLLQSIDREVRYLVSVPTEAPVSNSSKGAPSNPIDDVVNEPSVVSATSLSPG